MAAPDVPAAKRAGLAVDIDRLAVDGDDWLTPAQRYALKTYGVCAQQQEHVFMVRIRIAGGVLPTEQARGVARLARRFGPDWLHITTRQNLELHWVRDRDVPSLLEHLAQIGMTTRSACGHTMRNVICSEDAGVGLDEPFDCLPDARLVSDAFVARSAELNVALPSRVNISFGGSPWCREHARMNDASFVSVLRDGEPGYELWAGGSLGKSPSLAIRVAEFVPRPDTLRAAEAIFDVFIAHGDFDNPSKARLKFAVAALGEDGFRAEWQSAFAAAEQRPHPDPPVVEVLDDADHAAILARRPPGGWSQGVRPQRTPGLALLTIDVPLGDTNASELDLIADLADRYGDGHVVLSRDQDIVLRNVPVEHVSAVRAALLDRGLFFAHEARVPRVRACTGSAVCALGITDAPGAGRELATSLALGRNASLRVHVSGCPNSCAQHQAADIGLAGAKVRVRGATDDGYHLFLGADIVNGVAGEAVGRVAESDVPAAVTAVVGLWEALRHPGESLAQTVRRIGIPAVGQLLEAAMDDRFATGVEPETELVNT
ncbi:MAG: ferredoxin-nitrite reductase [Actinomycetota bacterium]|jgi:sulfite reductase beta subunit-like hemoprotein